MKTIIAGGRDITDYNEVLQAVNAANFSISEVVSGCARGADKLGEMYAAKHGIPAKKFPADWDGLGKKAGHVRNRQMGDYADALIALWDGESKGTKGMIEYATTKNLAVYVHLVNQTKGQA